MPFSHVPLLTIKSEKNDFFLQKELLVSFAKSRKELFGFVMFIFPIACPSVRIYQSTSHWTDFGEIFYWGFMIISHADPNLI